MTIFRATTVSGGIYEIDTEAKTYAKVSVGTHTASRVPVLSARRYVTMTAGLDDDKWGRIEVDRPLIGEQLFFQGRNTYDWVRTSTVVELEEVTA
jgi:hypothetical protein